MEPNTNPVSVQNNLQGPVTLLVSSWQFFKLHYKVIVPIIVLPGLFIVVGQIMAITKFPIAIIIAVILFFVGIILSIGSQPAAINAVNKMVTENPNINLVDQYKIGFKYFWAVVLLSILQFLIFSGSVIFFVIPAIIISIYLTFYIFVLVLENKKAYQSFTESYSLVFGRWFPVLGRLVFLAMIFLAGIIVFSGISFVIRIIFNVPELSLTESIISVILNFILNSIVGSFAVIYMYKLYQSLKLTRIPNVQAVTFRKWLIAFTVIGVIVIIGVISTIMFVLSSLIVR